MQHSHSGKANATQLVKLPHFIEPTWSRPCSQ